MVKIAIAGGSGNVAPHVIEALADTKKHHIIVLSRKAPGPAPQSGVNEHKQVDYSSKAELVTALQGVEVVLSFILPFADAHNIAQKTLIDASVQAGVRRFAPSEWAVSSNTTNPFYRMRDQVRQYLENVNAASPVLEYTCFQPGLFLDYFAYPHQSAKYLKITQHYVDFDSMKALVPDDGDQPVTFTLIDDLARVVAAAVEYEGKWPADGGVAGWTTTTAELLRLGEKIRGRAFTVYKVDSGDLRKGELKSPWCPILEHPSLPKDQLQVMSRKINLEALKGITEGAWTVHGSWNSLLPDFEFTDPGQYLETWWNGRE